jgi:hypothetical protein
MARIFDAPDATSGFCDAATYVISLAKVLMIAGCALLLVGALLFLGQRLGLGRLPGDFSWRGKNFSFHFPVATSLLVSLVLTLLINLWLRRSR